MGKRKGAAQNQGAKVGGLQFIATTSSHGRPDKTDSKLIKGHVTRNRPKSKNSRELPSWINNEDGSKKHKTQDVASIPIRVGSDFSLVQFPSFMKPDMLRDLMHFLTASQDILYPMEICLKIDPVRAPWFGCLLSDEIYLHSMLFATYVFFHPFSNQDQSSSALYYCAKTLKLLRDRLSNLESEAATSDATIMTVITLAGITEFLGDREAARNHREGLSKMVALRGGLPAMNGYSHRLRRKACSMDIGLALCFGDRPLFFRDEMSWDSYIAAHSPIRKRHVIAVNDELSTFLETLDQKLGTVQRDIHEFSLIINLAYQTKRNIDQNMFTEMMVSILYRLLYLEFQDNSIDEVMRIGMVAISSSMFIRGRGRTHRTDHWANIYQDALLEMQTSDIRWPPPVQLWLLFIYVVYADIVLSKDDWLSSILKKTVEALDIRTWDEVKKVLKSIAWIDFLHDPPGKIFFESWSQTVNC